MWAITRSFVTLAVVGVGVGAVLVSACDDAVQLPEGGTLVAALDHDPEAASYVAAVANPTGVTLMVPRPSVEPKAEPHNTTARPIRRAEVEVYVLLESGPLGPLERFELTFTRDQDTRDLVPIRVPRSFDAVDVRLDLRLFDEHGASEQATVDLPAGFAAGVEQVPCEVFTELRVREAPVAISDGEKLEVTP